MTVFFHDTVLRQTFDDHAQFMRVVATPLDGSLIAITLPLPKKSITGAEKVQESIRDRTRAFSCEELKHFRETGLLKAVQVKAPPGALRNRLELSKAEARQAARRKEIMEPFLQPAECSKIFEIPGELGRTVRRQCTRHGCSRNTVYTLLGQLIRFGFSESSLLPQYSLCGGPNIRRPITASRKKAGRRPRTLVVGDLLIDPQRGLSETEQEKIIALIRSFGRETATFGDLYARVLDEMYVKEYLQDDKGDLKRVMPPMGTYPNERQIRHLQDTSISRLELLRSFTTAGNFDRNVRGQTGLSFEGYDGPGHCYAVDSTIGDIYLRHSINRNWIIGRPIVYIIVDVWSTAVVGFYVCLDGPSWLQAKIALYSTFADPDFVAQLRGCLHTLGLDPTPPIPFQFLCDRGEYLSEAAYATAGEIGFDLSFNSAYRPDLKGIVEVLHRIAKDIQFRFIPGAINARRRELELRKTDSRLSVLTLPEYVRYLQAVFQRYNLFADRKHRLTAHMIGQGVNPIPAGLWRFGYEAGIGFGGAKPHDLLTSRLLPQMPGRITKQGIYLGKLRYESERFNEQKLTTLARHFGAIDIDPYYYPGNTAKVWTPDAAGGELHELTLSASALASPNLYFEEVADAWAYDQLKTADREHERHSADLSLRETTKALVESATAKTRAADVEAVGKSPHFKDARQTDPAAIHRNSDAPATPAADEASDHDAIYAATMAEIFAEGPLEEADRAA